MVNSKAPHPNRRVVLQSAAGIGVATLAGSFDVHAGDSRSSESPNPLATGDWLATADEAFFSQHIGSHFEFWSTRGRASASLTSVQSYVSGRDQDDRVHAFSLVFLILESTRAAPSNLCNVTHAKLGTFELFATEANSNQGERLLIATFARAPKTKTVG
jgi:hypothetical protein